MLELRQAASKDILRYQISLLYAQLQLLQDHAGDHERCPCEMKDETSEFCIPKHCIAIAEGYCLETIPMTDNEQLKQVLNHIKNGTGDLRREYEEAQELGKEPAYAEIAQWARESRKELEPYLWTYKKQPDKEGIEMGIDPILAEVTNQICSTGVCFAGKKKGRLPICNQAQRELLEDCILEVKKKIKETGYKGNPFAICRRSIGCRIGGSEKYEERVAIK